MRICFISNLFPPHGRGGAERVAETEARALLALGHDVSVITAAPLPEDGDPRPRTSVEDGLRMHRFYPINLFFYGEIGAHSAPARLIWHAWDAMNGSAARAVKRLLREERPDVVHTHNLKGLGFRVPAAIRSLKLRHVHTLHDVQLAVPSGLLMKGRERAPEANGLAARAFSALLRRQLGSPDVVISPSRFLLNFYRERNFFPRSARLWVPNPMPRQAPAPHAPSVETRFLFLGQVEAHKGVPLLIDAFTRLLQERPKAHLDVVGAGALAAPLARAAGKELRIAFHGKLQPSQFRELFTRADYTVVPSLCYENAPTVIGESFAHGVPVVVADIGGAAELVRDGKNGLVFEAGNAGALLAALRRACDEKGAWPARANAALRSSLGLDPASHARRLEDIYLGRDAALPLAEAIVPIRAPRIDGLQRAGRS